MYKDHETRKQKHKEWQQSAAGKEWLSKYLKEYTKRNPEKVKGWHDKYKMQNPEKLRETKRKYRSNPRNRRREHLKFQYGITGDQFDAIMREQEGKCKICKLVKPLQVDHCHQTGAVRGLLCRQCNTMLGFAKDNTATLEAAILYLNGYKN